MSLEIETKLHLASLTAAHQAIERAQAEVVIPRVFEQNVRYDNADKSLSPQGIVLRLRQDNQVRLTYKAPFQEAQHGIVKRLELETSVGDFETMAAILQHLGFYPYMRYEKYRTTYHLPQLANTEIVLDEMPYGVFIEVEGEQIAAATALLGLDIGKGIAASYSELFEHVKKHYHLTFNDLSFENFAGLEIAPEIFAEFEA